MLEPQVEQNENECQQGEASACVCTWMMRDQGRSSRQFLAESQLCAVQAFLDLPSHLAAQQRHTQADCRQSAGRCDNGPGPLFSPARRQRRPPISNLPPSPLPPTGHRRQIAQMGNWEMGVMLRRTNLSAPTSSCFWRQTTAGWLGYLGWGTFGPKKTGFPPDNLPVRATDRTTPRRPRQPSVVSWTLPPLHVEGWMTSNGTM
ncbi:hypothetical protein BGZ63DRAFT_21743 [Mariannaea sp. PMI_226]|nr:hypothetical protein BGZ63DRAFT_21743 [Mariannaea sp. PMI_226]